jgi:alkyldihydroxyacetonephosphate synthase
MRRWNGWGDVRIDYPLPASASLYLENVLGSGIKQPDATLEHTLECMPASRLDDQALFTRDPMPRLLHARGQSLPDWVALRSGEIGAFPDGVAYPEDYAQIAAILAYAQSAQIHLIPYGGGTSVVGHINPLTDGPPVLSVDCSRLNGLYQLDETDHLATFGAGIRGPDLEGALNARGYTLGHYPQSFEYSTLGGWIATRSTGQQSYYYGRIEQLLAGCRLETPRGTLELAPIPASAAGPDLRQLVLGSEGRLGVITQAQVRVRPLPETEAFYAAFFPDWGSGVAALQNLAQDRVPASMLRLSDAQETETTLVLSGQDRLVTWAQRGLNLLGYGPERCLMIYGLTGSRLETQRVQRRLMEIIRAYRGLPVGEPIGKIWKKSRFRSPYLRNTLWEHGYALDTLETAVPWKQVMPLAAALKSLIAGGLEQQGERVLVFAHLSHVYETGASIYVTFLFRRGREPQETLRRWQKLKSSASQEILAYGGTISHQHGVGLDHAPYLAAEKGALGITALEEMVHTWDPGGLLNPGKLVPEPTQP